MDNGYRKARREALKVTDNLKLKVYTSFDAETTTVTVVYKNCAGCVFQATGMAYLNPIDRFQFKIGYNLALARAKVILGLIILSAYDSKYYQYQYRAILEGTNKSYMVKEKECKTYNLSQLLKRPKDGKYPLMESITLLGNKAGQTEMVTVAPDYLVSAESQPANP